MQKECTKLSKQKGVTIVEFTIVASLFFILIFSIIEFGRLIKFWPARWDNLFVRTKSYIFAD